MVQVLVLGATGFIGSSVALALRRAGHVVHALLRDSSSSKAKDLERHEIATFKGDVKDGSTWKEVAAKMDVVIDCADTMLAGGIFKTVLEVAKSRPKATPKLTFIYTSGAWVHGDSRKYVTDRSPLPGPVSPKIVTTWRPDLEQQMISATTREVLETLIIRPGVVFGGSSTIYQTWFGALFEAKKKSSSGGSAVEIIGKKDALIATVHKEDLAQAYRLLVEKSTLLAAISYPIFDIANSPESLHQLVIAAANALGFDSSHIAKITYKVPSSEDAGGFFEALSTSLNTSSERARDLLGWQARHPSMTAQMEVYIRAIGAHLE